MKEEYLNMSHKIVDIKSLVTQNQDGHYNLVIREMSLCNEYDMSDYVNGFGEEESRKYFELLWKLIESISDAHLQPGPPCCRFASACSWHHTYAYAIT